MFAKNNEVDLHCKSFNNQRQWVPHSLREHCWSVASYDADDILGKSVFMCRMLAFLRQIAQLWSGIFSGLGKLVLVTYFEKKMIKFHSYHLNILVILIITDEYIIIFLGTCHNVVYLYFSNDP